MIILFCYKKPSIINTISFSIPILDNTYDTVTCVILGAKTYELKGMVDVTKFCA